MKEKMADDMEAEDDLFEDKSGAYFGQDLQRLESTHSKSGYREGITDGQESCLQKGFNDGFSEAAREYMIISKLRGCISALLIFLKTNETNNSVENCVNELEHCLVELKDLEAKQPDIDRTEMIKKHEQTEEKKSKPAVTSENINIDDAVEMMDCVKLDDDNLIHKKTHPTNLCAGQCSCDTSAVNKCECKNVTDIDDANIDASVTGNLMPAASTYQGNTANQKLTLPFCFDAEWKKVEVILEKSGLPEQLVNRLKMVLSYERLAE